MTRLIAVIAVIITVPLSPRDVPEQCDQQVFARSNPGLCYPGPLGQMPPTGGGGRGDGGLLGTIGRVLHGITGGLL
jgi:hypothetical protein